MASGNGTSGLVAVVLKDLERKVEDWDAKVQAEKVHLQEEWDLVKAAKEKVAVRMKILSESAEEISAGLAEIKRMKGELNKRLAVTPMDLDASQLQEEWKKIDEEKLALKKSADELHKAVEKLADAQAAFDMVQ